MTVDAVAPFRTMSRRPKSSAPPTTSALYRTGPGGDAQTLLVTRRAGSERDLPFDSLPYVLLTGAMSREVLAPLEGVAHFIMPSDGGDLVPRAEVLELAPLLSGIVNHGELRVDAGLLDAGSWLKIVANASIGVDNFDLPLMRARGVWATNTPDAYTEATADCTLGLILCVARRLVCADAFVRSGAWKGFQPGRWDGTLLRGKTLGIVGYGRIGQAVESRARAFGLKVIHYRRTRGDPAVGYASLEALLGESDFVSLHSPLNRDSERLFDAARLAQMKRGACLVNVGRGRVVDEAALVAALQSGHLAGAALDVFEDEPRVHPALLTMSQVVLTPHLGGGAKESRFVSRRRCAENVAAVLQGRRALTPVGLAP